MKADNEKTQEPVPADTPKPAGSAVPGTGGSAVEKAEEIGGPVGPEPTRYGDWERKGRVSDF